MATDQRRSFFATTTGVVTGLAGAITAVVGLLTAGVQLGWWGSDGNGGGGGGTSVTTTATSGAQAQLRVDPSSVKFEVLGPKEQVVTVRNQSTTAPVSLRPVSVSGPDRAAFTASDVSCGSRLDPGRTCDVRVRFAPSRSGDFAGRLVVQPDAGPAMEVDLVGKALL